MKKLCIICKNLKNTPYKNKCRNCYQKLWLLSLNEKKCLECGKTFKNAGKICHTCQSNTRNKKSKENPCSHCERTGLIIRGKKLKLCLKCERILKEKTDPIRKEKRLEKQRYYSRKKRGSDLNAPIRKPTGKWKNKKGYVLMYRPLHPNKDKNGCIYEHIYIMSLFLGRPIIKGETIHHKNGIKDDNRLENLELWNKSHPPGQRLQDKIDWAIKFLNECDFTVI